MIGVTENAKRKVSPRKNSHAHTTQRNFSIR